jgi:hypothetical protein
MYCHLSALAGLLVGGLTFIGPLVCWLVKKDTSPLVDAHGKESLNFQLSMLVYQLAAIAVSFVTCGLGLPINLVLLVCSIAMPIIAGLKVNEGRAYRYPLTIRFIAEAFAARTRRHDLSGGPRPWCLPRPPRRDLPAGPHRTCLLERRPLLQQIAAAVPRLAIPNAVVA